jgi:hypothetical protein
VTEREEGRRTAKGKGACRFNSGVFYQGKKNPRILNRFYFFVLVGSKSPESAYGQARTSLRVLRSVAGGPEVNER